MSTILGEPQVASRVVTECNAVKNRMHLDPQPPPGSSRGQEVERALRLGAEIVDDRRQDTTG